MWVIHLKVDTLWTCLSVHLTEVFMLFRISYRQLSEFWPGPQEANLSQQRSVCLKLLPALRELTVHLISCFVVSCQHDPVLSQNLRILAHTCTCTLAFARFSACLQCTSAFPGKVFCPAIVVTDLRKDKPFKIRLLHIHVMYIVIPSSTVYMFFVKVQLFLVASLSSTVCGYCIG